jgi:hypothetical protein
MLTKQNKDMTAKRKPTNISCIYEKEISEMHKILVGNGDPDSSMVRRVALIGERQNNVIFTLDKIEPKLDGLLSEITEVRSGLATLKSNVNNKEIEAEKAEKLRREKKRDNWYRGLTIAGIAVMISLGVWNHFTGYTNKEEIIATKDTLRHEIRMQEGISKVTRNGYVKYNDAGLSDSVKILK